MTDYNWHQVECDSVEEFLERYYKPERYNGRGEEYAAALLESHKSDYVSKGYDLISRHDSVTGQAVCWRGPEFPIDNGDLSAE